eukprot:gnl/Dysnectes_brevis/966_a1076_3295.p1 GENE.gnl/Dysnectes_brevis/966_a1076_3295~~gnl/Dysnectes_brevis/966_a1076_3295.p1  ORF type:complete len:299 (+),score=22.78 gnl/Dysnectes_brevis/966_a1076_3295:30-926(+)
MEPPNGLACKYCSKKWFAHGLIVHERACHAKCQVFLKPIGQKLAPHVDSVVPKSRRNIPGFNEQQQRFYITQWIPCPKCQRRFPPLAIREHSEFCTEQPVKKARRPATGAPRSPAPTSSTAMAPGDSRIRCTRCGRAFSAERITKHESICTKLRMEPKKAVDSPGARTATPSAGGRTTAVRSPPHTKTPTVAAPWRRKANGGKVGGPGKVVTAGAGSSPSPQPQSHPRPRTPDPPRDVPGAPAAPITAPRASTSGAAASIGAGADNQRPWAFCASCGFSFVSDRSAFCSSCGQRRGTF